MTFCCCFFRLSLVSFVKDYNADESYGTHFIYAFIHRCDMNFSETSGIHSEDWQGISLGSSNPGNLRAWTRVGSVSLTFMTKCLFKGMVKQDECNPKEMLSFENWNNKCSGQFTIQCPVRLLIPKPFCFSRFQGAL
jgi:hypothetical protein